MIKLIRQHPESHWASLTAGNFPLFHGRVTAVLQLNGLKLPLELQALINAWLLHISLHQCTPGGSLQLTGHRDDPWCLKGSLGGLLYKV